MSKLGLNSKNGFLSRIESSAKLEKLIFSLELNLVMYSKQMHFFSRIQI